MKEKESNCKSVYSIERVAVITPKPTRWEILFMGILGSALFLVGWLQYSYVAEARVRRAEIPQIVVTATIQAEGYGSEGAGGGGGG